MSTLDYFQLIQELRPNSIFSINGNDYSTLVWSTNNSTTEPTEEEILSKNTEMINTMAYDLLRIERNELLINSDKYSLPDYPHTNDSLRNQWLTYRQQLRDITSQTPTIDANTGGITGITWPTPPQ